MQSLKLSQKEFNNLRLTKTVTIRKGRKDVKLGFLEFYNIESGAVELVNVESVQYCKLKYVSSEDLLYDGMISTNHAVSKLIQYYPDITKETEITVIKFKIILK